MRYYIGTVWFLAPGKDDSYLQMRIFKVEAEDRDHFMRIIALNAKHIETGSQLWFGPISLSKEQ